MKKVLMIVATTLILVLSLTACVFSGNDLYGDLNKMAQSSYSKTDVVVSTHKNGVTLKDTANFVFSGTAGAIDMNNGELSYTTQRLAEYEVKDGVLVAPESFIVEKSGTAKVENGKVIGDEEALYDTVSGFGFRFDESYFTNVTSADGSFQATVSNPASFFGAEKIDAKKMTVKISFSNGSFEKLQLAYKTSDGTSVEISYNFTK